MPGPYLYPLRGEKRFAARSTASILVVSIWIVIFLSVLAFGLVKIVSQQLRLADTLEKTTAAYYMGRAFYYKAAAERVQDITGYDGGNEFSQAHEETLGGMRCTWRVYDESARINVNKRDKDILKNIPGLNEELAEKIIASIYRPFPASEGLYMVEGITRDIFKECKDYVTVYGNGKININTVSREVLQALGLSESLVDLIIEYRKGADLAEGTDDDIAFESEASILADLQKYYMLTLDQQQEMLSLTSKDILSVSSDAFRVKINFCNNAGKPLKNFDIVCKKNENGWVDVLYWTEY